MRADAPDGSAAETPLGVPVGTLLLLVFASGLLFGCGVFVTELAGEVVTDVDLKPFFIPYLLAGVVPLGVPTFAVALGAAFGEGALDVAEGYEPDDPFGFVGYVLGVLVFSYLLHAVAPDPTDWRWQVVAAVAGALVQALCEGAAFLLLRETTTLQAAVSVLGNTLSHGFFLGAVPLVLLYPLLADRSLPLLAQAGETK